MTASSTWVSNGTIVSAMSALGAVACVVEIALGLGELDLRRAGDAEPPGLVGQPGMGRARYRRVLHRAVLARPFADHRAPFLLGDHLVAAPVDDRRGRGGGAEDRFELVAHLVGVDRLCGI